MENITLTLQEYFFLCHLQKCFCCVQSIHIKLRSQYNSFQLVAHLILLSNLHGSLPWPVACSINLNPGYIAPFFEE